MLPVAPLLFTAGTVMKGAYAVGKTYDNVRYWSDYYRNTGYRPRYPFRAGQYDYLKDFGSTFNSASALYNKW